MEIRVNKALGSKDPLLSTIQGCISLTQRKLNIRKTQGVSANGDGSDSVMNMGIMMSTFGWRVVGIGGYVVVGGLSTKAESGVWGFLVSDIGAADEDAFGSFVCNTTASKQFTAGDIIYQGITPFENVLGLDALAIADSHTWDISGTGAGVQMGVWQTKAAFLSFTKKNVANSDATICPFFVVEYNLGDGVI